MIFNHAQLGQVIFKGSFHPIILCILLCLEHCDLQDTYAQSIFPEFCPLILKPAPPSPTSHCLVQGEVHPQLLREACDPLKAKHSFTLPPTQSCSSPRDCCSKRHTAHTGPITEPGRSKFYDSYYNSQEEISFCWSCYENRPEWLPYHKLVNAYVNESKTEHSTAKRLRQDLIAVSELPGPDIPEACSTI